MKHQKRKGRIDIIPYSSGLVKKAKELRNNATPAEKFLWSFISRKQIYGYDFDRQTPIDRYIVDFFCKELKLAIELDGIYHELQSEQDFRRQNRIESFGVKMIRFEEKQVLEDIESILEEICYWVKVREELFYG